MDEKIYVCEVKKLFRRGEQKQWEWVEMPVKKALEDGVTQFRCKDLSWCSQVAWQECGSWTVSAY